MAKLLLPLSLFLFFTLTSIDALAQRILLNEDFENAGLNSDSLPVGWVQYDDDARGEPGVEWSVRNSGIVYPGANPQATYSRSNSGNRALTIAWSAGDSLVDHWVFTDSVKVQAGDSLQFWMLLGGPSGVLNYLDSMQVLVSQANVLVGNGFETKLASIKSQAFNNFWMQYKFDLSAFAGQTLHIAFRYFMDIRVNGMMCNIDDVFIGNRSSVGISPIGTGIPSSHYLSQNYPNPFNPETKIKFGLANTSDVKLTVFNFLGQVVKTLVNSELNAGYYEVSFNSNGLASGTYFYKLEAGNVIFTKKMLLIK